MFDTLQSKNGKLAGASAALLLAALFAAPAQAAGNTRTIIFDSCAKPEYPKADIQAKHEGKVTLGFKADAAGKVTDSKVLTSSGFTSLDDAARDALSKCSFSPAPNGAADKTWTKVTYVWTLK